MSLKDILANRMAQNAEKVTEQKINPLLAHRMKIAQQKTETPEPEKKEVEKKNEEPVKITQELVNKVVNKTINMPENKPEELKNEEESLEINDKIKSEESEEEEFKLQTETAMEIEAHENFNTKKTEPKLKAEIPPENVDENIATEEINEEVLEEPPKENKQQKSKSTKKKSSTSKTKTDDSQKIQTLEFDKINILGQKFSYNEAAALVMDEFIDDEWKKYEKEITEKLDKIRIEPDMNPGTLKYALADLNNLYDEISIPLIEQKKILESLTDKDFGIASAYKNANKNNGSNENEREANAIAALTEVGENKINLIALIAAARMRYIFLISIFQRIQYKSNICITMSGAIKMEMNLINGAQ